MSIVDFDRNIYKKGKLELSKQVFHILMVVNDSMWCNVYDPVVQLRKPSFPTLSSSLFFPRLLWSDGGESKFRAAAVAWIGGEPAAHFVRII